ncbi:MAG: GNAT family N-acetyltransferase, partial [Anaerolineales bacterium]|nr:GNAT family N-acetyltransferase [Anaerolineales bacterium]
DLQDVITVLAEVWHGDFAWVWDRLGAHLEIPGYLNVYAAYVNDVPASVAWIYFHPGSQFASLWGGSTREAYRRRGLYAALLRARAQAALRQGARYLTVDATPMSAPILERHGFVQIATAWACEVNV